MIEAWLSSSERMTVFSSASVGMAASFAFQHETYVSDACGADEVGQLALELVMHVERPADEAHGTRAGAVPAEPFDPRLHDLGPRGEPEVVVRREDEHLAPALHLHHRPLR